jgi:hypothetical protein
MESREQSIHEKNIPFMQFAFGDNYIEKTKLESLAYWNEKYGHDLKIEEEEDINYSLDKMYEHYRRSKA